MLNLQLDDSPHHHMLLVSETATCSRDNCLYTYSCTYEPSCLVCLRGYLCVHRRRSGLFTRQSLIRRQTLRLARTLCARAHGGFTHCTHMHTFLAPTPSVHFVRHCLPRFLVLLCLRRRQLISAVLIGWGSNRKLIGMFAPIGT